MNTKVETQNKEDRSYEIALRLEMIRCYDLVKENIAKLQASIHSDAHLPAWVLRTESEQKNNVSHRDKASWIIGLIHYLDDQEAKEAITCPGILGASEETIKIAEQLNAAKNDFQSAMLALKGYKLTLAEPYIRDIDNPVSMTSESLKQAGLSRIHLKQTYRTVPILDEKPIRIGFTWANTRSIKKIDSEEAESMLRKLGEDSRIQKQISMLSQLNDSEPLAIVHDTSTHVRANVVWQESHEPKAKMIGCPLPILIPMNNGDVLPAFAPVGDKKDRTSRKKRKSRTDVKLEAKPFLPSIYAYRYLRAQDAQ